MLANQCHYPNLSYTAGNGSTMNCGVFSSRQLYLTSAPLSLPFLFMLLPLLLTLSETVKALLRNRRQWTGMWKPSARALSGKDIIWCFLTLIYERMNN